MRENNIPYFFKDNSEKEHEIMLDYFLGWTLRCAQESNEMLNLRVAAKKILGFLFSVDINNYFVEEVKVWKQWSQMDLCGEVLLKDKQGLQRKIAFVIENKMYTHVRDGQLNKYRQIFENFYTSEANQKTNYERKYILLTCHYLENQLKADFDEAKNLGYTPIRFDLIKTECGLTEKTGNFMFDEFWFEYF